MDSLSPNGPRSIRDLPTPLARVYGMAMELGIEVNEKDLGGPEYGALLSHYDKADGTDQHFVLVEESLGDDLKAHVLVFALALSVLILQGLDTTDLTQPEGDLIVIGRDYRPLAEAGLGHLASLMADGLGVEAPAPVFEILADCA